MIYKALILAYNAHSGQVDKGGNPYILHPVTLALNLETEDEKTVALLHDVVEDTPITTDYLMQEGFPKHVVEAVDALTKKEGENYGDYLRIVKSNELARKVKIEDLRHNSDLTRLKNITDKDLNRVKRYKMALEYLIS